MMSENTRRAPVRLVLAAMIASAAAAVVPASAAPVLAPNLSATSVDSGWTNSSIFVAATFDRSLAMATSSVTVTDGVGANVDGSDFVQIQDASTIRFQPQAPFTFDAGPYTATFTVRAQGQDASLPATVVSKTFNVDVVTPFPPNVALNGASSPLTVSLGTEALEVTGIAKDNENGSGIQTVSVHFYNPAANPHRAGTGGIPQVGQHNTAIDCPGGICPTQVTLAIDLSTLPAGLWTLKVSVTDAAGNRSGESGELRVLRVAA